LHLIGTGASRANGQVERVISTLKNLLTAVETSSWSWQAKVTRFCVGDFVLLKDSERQQTKLDPKFRGPFLVVDVLDGDRYVLKSTQNNRRYPHESLRKLPMWKFQKSLMVITKNKVSRKSMLTKRVFVKPC